jgi:alpha-beta hydrolase superfamily lysophospholipase
MKRREFLIRSLGFATGAVGLVAAGPAGRVMASPAQGHRILDLELFDTDRQRPVPVRLYLPQQASAESPVPLIVFSHGLGGSRMGYSYLARHWANAGLASLHPQHVGSDHSVWRGNPLELLQRLQTAAHESEALARVLDLRFALNHVLSSDQGLLLNAASIAVAGHSYGANTAMLVAGAQVTTGDPNLSDLRDRRIQAAILISAPPLIGQGPARQVLSTVSLPTLHITSLEDTINLPGYRSTVEDRIAIFDAMAQSPRTLAVYNTGGHSIFTDRTTRSGPETSIRIKGATQELCTIFLRRSLNFGHSPASTESMTNQPGLGVNPCARKDAIPVQKGLSLWADRHKDLLDRFTSRET